MKSALFLPLVLLGVLGFRLVQIGHNTSNYVNGQPITIESFLLSEPDVSGNRQQFFMSTLHGDRITVITPVFPVFHYGDFVRVSGTIQTKVLNDGKVVNSIYFPTIKAEDFDHSVSFGVEKTILAFSRAFREHFVTVFQTSLPAQEANLLTGMVLGVKQPLSKKFSDDLRNGGVFHVIAASGMNVTLVATFFTVLLASYMRRQTVLWVTIAGIWFYAAVSGFQPSIMRASLMSTAVFFSQVIGRQSLSWYSLGITALLMLIVSPVLMTDIGFQLSFSSTIGLIFLSPLQKIKRLESLGGIGSDMITTVSAQLATLPILLANFGTYSLWSVVINGLVLWTIPLLMVLGGVAGLLGFLFQPLSTLLTYLCLPMLWYFETVVTVFGDVTSPIKIGPLSWMTIVGYYLVLAAGIVWLHQRTTHEESDS